MEKTRFLASLKMSQCVSDMSPSAIDVLMLGIQIMLVAGEGTIGLMERKQLVVSGT
jgi:hypothetical protein